MDSPNERCVLRHDSVQPTITVRLIASSLRRRGKGEAVTGSCLFQRTALRRSKFSSESDNLFCVVWRGPRGLRIETESVGSFFWHTSTYFMICIFFYVGRYIPDLHDLWDLRTVDHVYWGMICAVCCSYSTHVLGLKANPCSTRYAGFGSCLLLGGSSVRSTAVWDLWDLVRAHMH